MRLMKIWLLCLTLLTVTSCDDTPIPSRAQKFIDRYFPKCSVVLVETGEEENVAEYEVLLNDGTKIDFDMQGDWRRVSRNKSGVPATLIPAAIMQYIRTNYPNNVVTKFSKKDYGYKVELSDDMDLRFTRQGAFIDEID